MFLKSIIEYIQHLGQQFIVDIAIPYKKWFNKFVGWNKPKNKTTYFGSSLGAFIVIMFHTFCAGLIITVIIGLSFATHGFVAYMLLFLFFGAFFIGHYKWKERKNVH